ncbi:hypothetical protein [Comamonas badia]|uniref:hypothetical protein n=1 Tax=Comamonas badia TaxID=265291 RepID=UPI0005594BA1|nr:hypothetical protein [Comamonas badia]
MSDSKPGPSDPQSAPLPPSLIAVWREWVAKGEGAWSEVVTQWMRDERVGPTLARQVDEGRILHRLYVEAAQAGLGLANLPSRTDLEMLDERLGRVEDGLASVAAALYRLRDALAAQGVPGAALPRAKRDRKPPQAPAPHAESPPKPVRKANAPAPQPVRPARSSARRTDR